MSVSGVRLYVKSAKTVSGTVEEEVIHSQISAGRGEILLPPITKIGPEREYILPEDQQKTSEIIKNAASRQGLQVEVIDVGRENILHRAIQEEREKIKTFPALIADSGERIEGNITEEQADSFLSRIADRTRKKYL